MSLQSHGDSPSGPCLSRQLAVSQALTAVADPIVPARSGLSSSGFPSLYFSYRSISSVRYVAFFAFRMNLCLSRSFAVGLYTISTPMRLCLRHRTTPLVATKGDSVSMSHGVNVDVAMLWWRVWTHRSWITLKTKSDKVAERP
jgi:hypothetical protein